MKKRGFSCFIPFLCLLNVHKAKKSKKWKKNNKMKICFFWNIFQKTISNLSKLTSKIVSILWFWPDFSPRFFLNLRKISRNAKIYQSEKFWNCFPDILIKNCLNFLICRLKAQKWVIFTFAKWQFFENLKTLGKVWGSNFDFLKTIFETKVSFYNMICRFLSFFLE